MKYILKEELAWYLDRTWRNIRKPFRWLKRHLTKEHRELVKEAIKFEPWDWWYLTNIEKVALERMIAYHKQSQLVVDWERIVREMELCCRLVDIYNETEDLTKRMPTGKYVFLRVFNSKNAHRFVDSRTAELLGKPDNGLTKEYIYQKKAEYLYHKIRAEREQTWWD